MALAPKFEELAARYAGRIDFLKMDRSQNKEIMKELSLRGVPTIIFMKDGNSAAPRLTGDEQATEEKIRAAAEKIIGN
ncbi:MAG: thioredoxin family protein [Cloacibacillus sp.]